MTVNESFFNGHFPQHPVMPGVLIIESMAQTAGLMMLNEEEHKGGRSRFLPGSTMPGSGGRLFPGTNSAWKWRS